MSRNVFTSEELFAEFLCSRSIAFLEVLVEISRNLVWPQNIVNSFFLVAIEFQRLQNRYAEQFDGFSGEESSQYLCPSQQHNSGKRRACWSPFIKFYLEGSFRNAWGVQENRFAPQV